MFYCITANNLSSSVTLNGIHAVVKQVFQNVLVASLFAECFLVVFRLAELAITVITKTKVESPNGAKQTVNCTIWEGKTWHTCKVAAVGKPLRRWKPGLSNFRI